MPPVATGFVFPEYLSGLTNCYCEIMNRMDSLSVSEIKRLLRAFPEGLEALAMMVHEGFSPAMKRVERWLTACIKAINAHDIYVDRESPRSDCDPVPSLWITGERGVGKRELIHRIYEGCSERHYILELDCDTVDPRQIEAELFGYQAEGSRKETRRGKLVEAEAGILTISEPQMLTKICQRRLLEWQARRLRRSSDGLYEDPDPIIIFVAHQRPEALEQRGAVLPGLVKRALAHIHIPSLRECPEDVALLVEYFLRVKVLELTGWEFSSERNLQDDALFLLVNFHWPDNLLGVQEVIARLTGAILFDNQEHRITVAEVISALKKHYGNPDILELLAPLFRAQLKKWNRVKKDDAWLDELRVLRCLSDLGYDLEELANLLGISAPALSRRLSNAGLGGLTRGHRPK